MATLRLRPATPLLVACLGLYLAAAAQVRHPGGSALTIAVASVARPIHLAAQGILVAAAQLREDFRDLRTTRAQLAAVQEEVGQLRRVNQLLAAEVSALREAHRLVATLPTSLEGVLLARVVARDAVGDHLATIDRGRRHGVLPDAPVLAAEGVLGRVLRVGEQVSLVQLLSHPQAAAAAKLLGTEGEVLLSGGDRPTVMGLPAATAVEAGTPIVTTGSEGIYPPGLLLGFSTEATVESVLTKVPVRLAVRPHGVTVVAILPPSRGNPL